MADNSKNLIDAEQLAKNLVQDIAEFSKTASTIKVPKDLRKLDLASILPKTTVNNLKDTLVGLKADGDKVSQDQKAEIQAQTADIQEAIKTRQDNLKVSLNDIQKVAVDEDTVALVKVRMDETIKNYDIHIEGLRLEKVNLFNSVRVNPVADEFDKINVNKPLNTTSPG
jgi:hypothetical protein